MISCFDFGKTPEAEAVKKMATSSLEDITISLRRALAAATPSFTALTPSQRDRFLRTVFCTESAGDTFFPVQCPCFVRTVYRDCLLGTFFGAQGAEDTEV